MTSPTPAPRDLARTLFAVLLIGGLLAGCFLVLRPFLTATIWATMIVIATWRLMLALEVRLWRRRWLAVTVLTVILLAVFVVPLSLAVWGAIEYSDETVAFGRSLIARLAGPPPEWMGKVPLIGTRLDALWIEASARGLGDLATRLAPYAGRALGWVGARAGGFGSGLVQVSLTVIIAPILWLRGEAAGRGVLRFARRMAGDQGEEAALLAASAIRGVALGVIVTAVVQALLGGLGLAICGVPYAAALTGLMLVLGIAQLGPFPVLVPAVIWVYWQGHPALGTLLLIIALVVGVIDNVLRPVLIRKGADLPMLLIFVGVAGGLITFGILGLFVGPVLLAVAYKLTGHWIAEGERAQGAPAAQPSPAAPAAPST